MIKQTDISDFVFRIKESSYLRFDSSDFSYPIKAHPYMGACDN